MAPAKVPDSVAQILEASLGRAMNNDAFRASLEKIGYSVLRPRSRAAITEFIDADRARWADVIKTRHISLD